MGFLPWLTARWLHLFSRNIAPRVSNSVTARRGKSARPSLEVLEDRWVPSTVWYVNNSANGGNTGQSWADAFTDLQAGLMAAQSGDQVWVAKGTYLPTSTTDRTISFALKDGVGVYGGFAGTEALLTDRDIASNLTTLSGDIGTPGDNSDNSFHVVTSSGLTATAVLDGFTITAGAATGSFPDDQGGGMANISSSPTLSNLTFMGNLAHNAGGGMVNSSSSPTLTHVTFNGNSTSNAGGGIYNYSSSPTLTHVTFNSNSAWEGGGMENYSSSPTLTNVTFSSNAVAGSGGGMYDSSSNSMLTNVTFSSNSATAGNGGGMSSIGGSPSLTNVTFSNNSATGNGGGMSSGGSSPTLINVAFSGNTAGKDGGGLNTEQSVVILTYVTFSNNSATSGGGLLCTGITGFPGASPSSEVLTHVTFGNNTSTRGGGVYSSGYNSSPIMTDVIFSGNSATDGGGVYSAGSSNRPALTNVTFFNNSATGFGGDVFNDNSGINLMNCILWDDSASSGAQIVNVNASTVVSSSDVQGGWPGMGNLDVDPLFVDAANGDLHLQDGSPARYMGAFALFGVDTSTTLTSTSLNRTFSSSQLYVPLSASVIATSPAPLDVINEGHITFTLLDPGNTVIATLSGAVAHGVATSADYLPASLAVGSYQIHASFVPNSNNLHFTSSADPSVGTLTVAQDSTSTAVTSTGLNKPVSTSSQTITLTAAVSPGNSVAGGTVNEGTVTFTVLNASNVPVATLSGNAVSQGSASVSYDLKNLPAGSYHIHAAYVPAVTSPNFTSSSATSDGTLVIAKDSTTTAVTSTPLSKTFSSASQFVMLTASVSAGHPAKSGMVTKGTVTFTVLDATNHVVATLSGNAVSGGKASVKYMFSGLATGSYHIHAVYVPGAGNIDFATSENAIEGTLTIAPNGTTTAVTSTGLSKVYSTGSQIVTFSATVKLTNPVAGSEVNVGTVTFTLLDASNHTVATRSENAVVHGKASASYDLAGMPAGSYHIHAVYVPAAGNPNFTDSQDRTDGTLAVTKDRTTTAVTSTMLSALFSTASQKVTLRAQVSAGNTVAVGVVNEGSVTFTLLDAANHTVATLSGNAVSAGNASVSYDLAGRQAGLYHIHAVYVPANLNPNFTGSQDKDDGTLVVVRHSTNTMVTSTGLSLPFSTSSQKVILTALVTPANSGAGDEVDEGTVLFTIINASNHPVGTPVTSSTVSHGVAAVSYILPANTPIGTYFIRAEYHPKADFVFSLDNSISNTLTIGNIGAT